MVGCNFRFHWGLVKVKEMLDGGRIGRAVFAHAEFGQYLPDWHPCEDYRRGYSAQKSLGGGIILDGVHELDYLHWLLGEFNEVYCRAGKVSQLEIDVEDTADFVLQMKSRAVATVHLDYIQRSYNRSLELVGEEGTILWSYQDNTVKLYTATEKNWQTFGKDAPYDANEMYVDEMKHFLRCIQGKEQPIVDGREGKRILETALAAKESSRTKKAVFL
jgi:predicted dehydrogenase